MSMQNDKAWFKREQAARASEAMQHSSVLGAGAAKREELPNKEKEKEMTRYDAITVWLAFKYVEEQMVKAKENGTEIRLSEEEFMKRLKDYHEQHNKVTIHG